MAEDDKRGSNIAIPKNIEDYLTEEQKDALNNLERFGWSIQYIRRPAFQQVQILLSNDNGKTIGLLEEDGRINTNPDTAIRDNSEE